MGIRGRIIMGAMGHIIFPINSDILAELIIPGLIIHSTSLASI
jgi:hypothetical protein